jgi:5-methylcytosine-specific restriction enzyme subunit McrC
MSKSRTLSAFEHETIRVGSPESKCLSSPEFDALVRFNDQHEQGFFSVGHRSITFRQFVGYLQVGNLGIEILPKADRRARPDSARWRDVLHEMLRVGLGVDLLTSTTAQQSLTRPSLIDLVVSHFVPQVERVVHEGLARGYRDEESNSTTYRGKLVFSEHIRHNHSRRDRCFVRHSIFDRDTPANRLLRAGLDVAVTAPISSPLRTRVASALAHFENVRRDRPRPEAFDRLVLTRSTERYRHALLLSRMLVEALSPALRAGHHVVFAFLFDMNLLWEKYVAALFRRVARDRVRVSLQDRGRFLVHDDRPARIIRPDITLAQRDPKRVLAVLDTKWKLVAPGGADDDHLKQMFAYNEIFRASRAILLHPSAEAPRTRLQGEFWGRPHGCDVVELGLVGYRSKSIMEQIDALIAHLLPLQ